MREEVTMILGLYESRTRKRERSERNKRAVDNAAPHTHSLGANGAS